MLLSNVATKSVRDRTPVAVYVGVGLAFFSAVMIAVASSLESEMGDIFNDLPEAFTGLIGGASGNYAITELFGLLAPIAVLVVAISGGVSVLAREERDRTADLLLTHPVTRRHVVLAKAAVLVGNVTVACVLLLAGSAIAAAVIDIAGFGPADALAATVHLYFFGLAFGMIALLISNATGSTTAGVGMAAGLALLSNVSAGLLPLSPELAGAARISPWYYYNGGQPLTEGIVPGHLAVLAAIALVAFVLAVLVVDRRDIGSRAAGPRLAIPALATLGRYVRTNVSGIFAKTLTEYMVLIGVATGALFGMAVAMSLMYDGLRPTLAEFSDAFPANLKALLGASDFSTPAGWMQIEMLSLLAPIALIAVAVVMGVGAIAGEDAQRTLRLLVAGPVRRSRIVLEKAAALVVAVTLVAVGCWLGLVAGSALGGLDLAAGNLGAVMAHLALLAIFFGTLALAVGASSSSATATAVTAVAAVAAYFGDWLLGLRDGLADLALLSPWHYATSADPLTNGADFMHLAVLAVLSAVAAGAAVWLFERRELSA